jgi:hypothetical protein
MAVAPHIYAVGEVVEILPGRFDTHIPRGRYKIVRQLPSETHDLQYRVQSAQDGHERIVRESQLSRGELPVFR